MPDAAQSHTQERANKFFETDQRKDEFVATLAHEIRNPLAPIKTGLQLLALMGLSDEAEKVRTMMARQVDQIVRLVDDLLDISRMSCGKVMLDKQVCKVITVIEAAVEASSSLIAENGMKLEVIDNSNAACVCGDLCRLTQVFVNLLNNSAKFGRIGGNVSLTLDVVDGFVVIRVQDNGIGIAVDRLTDIFKMYSQIDRAQGRGAAGLGIGLAVVRNLVELHGGIVNAESDGSGCGSTFTVRLPLAVGILGGDASAKTTLHNSIHTLRVLVVEDLRAMRIVTEQLLGKLGHEVQVAENGEQALEMLETFRPDVVFSDIAMPVMDGYELARRIREKGELDSVRLVALSGYGRSSDREFAFEAGFDRQITKPINFKQLQELLDELDSLKHHHPKIAK
jgi:CheY-like chemotaxis protein/two-component sensor histidine kinase